MIEAKKDPDAANEHLERAWNGNDKMVMRLAEHEPGLAVKVLHNARNVAEAAIKAYDQLNEQPLDLEKYTC